MYATTREFLERFGLNDLTDLPKVEEMSDALGFELPMGLAEPTRQRPRRCRSMHTDEPAQDRTEQLSTETIAGRESYTEVVASRRRVVGRCRRQFTDPWPPSRLQKILSTAGISSRRAAEIADRRRARHGQRRDGHASSDRRRIRTPTTSASTAGASRSPAAAATSCCTSRAATSPTRSDPQQRPTVIDLLHEGRRPRLRLSRSAGWTTTRKGCCC